MSGSYAHGSEMHLFLGLEDVTESLSLLVSSVTSKRSVQEMSLKIQMEKNYVNRNAKQARELKDSNEKILALERTLQVRTTHSCPHYLCPNSNIAAHSIVTVTLALCLHSQMCVKAESIASAAA